MAQGVLSSTHCGFRAEQGTLSCGVTGIYSFPRPVTHPHLHFNKPVTSMACMAPANLSFHSSHHPVCRALHRGLAGGSFVTVPCKPTIHCQVYL